MKNRASALTPVLLLAAALLALPGCGEEGERPAFTVLNHSDGPIKHLVITDAGPILNYRNLDVGDSLTRKVPSPDKNPRPRTVGVHWEDGDGKRHQRRVELWKYLNSSYNGHVKLTLQRNGTFRVSKT